MKYYKNPKQEIRNELIQRNEINRSDLSDKVEMILNAVKNQSDEAVFSLTKEYDRVTLSTLKVGFSEIEKAVNEVPEALKKAIIKAKANIEKFHESQVEDSKPIETIEGVECWRESRPVERVGLYIPGGSAPLFSTVLMLGIPAKIAGCKEVVICTPPNKSGAVNPVILYTANLIGINSIYKVGGAQAIAAMTFGTESIPAVNKIFGPGNQFVTQAKTMVQEYGVAIDLPAGPSEVLVIADNSAEPEFVAADLLSQAEHGEDSQVILLSNDQSVIEETLAEIQIQLEKLPRRKIAQKALSGSYAILLNSLDDCFTLSNNYAPEHLILAVNKAEGYVNKIVNAGSVFLGNYSCESIGDYASGTNHTLPTNGYAKNYSGVSVDSFIKKVTFQKVSDIGLKNIGPSVEIMAEAEGLIAHKNAVAVRLKSM